MGDKKDSNKSFIENICKICRICPGPEPKFCIGLYEANRPKFLHHIIYKASLLREANSKKFEQLRTFEGFCALFCNKSSCPRYDKKECRYNLSKRVSCYEACLRQQSNTYLKMRETSRIYSTWSGIDPFLIGQQLKLSDSLQHVSKKKKKHLAKKIRKTMKGVYRGHSANFDDKNKTKKVKRQKIISTLLFHNQDNEEWGEKLKEYLNEDNNRQQSKAAGTAG